MSTPTPRFIFLKKKKIPFNRTSPPATPPFAAPNSLPPLSWTSSPQPCYRRRDPPPSGNPEPPPPPPTRHKVMETQSPAPKSAVPPPLSATRLWKTAAQRNLRNQWSKLSSLSQKWLSNSSAARSHATSLVNSYLSQRHMNAMILGALSDMPDIRNKASRKLFKQQETCRSKLLATYKGMVGVVAQMVTTSRSFRCYSKGMNSSPLAQFSCFAENEDDTGDGGGIPVFTFWSISDFEEIAKEFVQMFISELSLKRLLVMEFLSLHNDNVSDIDDIHWSDELYLGEFDDLRICGSYTASGPSFPSLGNFASSAPAVQGRHHPDRNVLEVYLTTWLSEVNIDRPRISEILVMVGEEMHVSLS